MSTTGLVVYSEPAGPAAAVAEHCGLRLTARAPVPNADGAWDERLILVVDSAARAQRCAQIVGSMPVAAVVAWRLPPHAARSLHRLGIPVFDGAPSKDELDVALAPGGWDAEAARSRNERVAGYETSFAAAFTRSEPDPMAEPDLRERP